jgi:hypothetical protein
LILEERVQQDVNRALRLFCKTIRSPLLVLDQISISLIKACKN